MQAFFVLIKELFFIENDQLIEAIEFDFFARIYKVNKEQKSNFVFYFNFFKTFYFPLRLLLCKHELNTTKLS